VVKRYDFFAESGPELDRTLRRLEQTNFKSAFGLASMSHCEVAKAELTHLS